MKTKQLFIIAAAAVGAYLVARAVFAKRRTATASPSSIANSALPGQPGYGWTYYDDGTAISPQGVYYYQGQEVWRPN